MPETASVPPPGTAVSASRRPGVVIGHVTSAMLARIVES